MSLYPSLVASRKKKAAAYEVRLSAWAPEDGVRPEERRQNMAHRQKSEFPILIVIFMTAARAE